MRFKLLLLLFLFTNAAIVVHAANNKPNATKNKKAVAGGVKQGETKKPISNVIITAYSIAKKEKIAHTDCNGNYSFFDLRPGIYKLTFEKDGYKKVTRQNVIIRPEEEFQLNIEMFESEDFKIMPGFIFSDIN